MTHRERIIRAGRGELCDVIPYVPRIDLWYNANAANDTLPERHKGRSQDEISRAEGWALHKVIPELLAAEKPEDNQHRALGIYDLKEYPFRHNLPKDVEVVVRREGDITRIEYHTPVGTASAATLYDDNMRKAGVSITWIQEHIIKKREDYKAVGYIFENLEVVPAYDQYLEWVGYIGDDGVACAAANFAASPMQHIQRDFLDATSFFYQYNDHYSEMKALAERIEHYFEQILRVVAESPAEIVVWGTNYDDMITYPTYFEKEISPWLTKACEILGSSGKLVLSHCDGENLGLMDIIRNSGIHIAEAICPHPMTKVKIEEYYRRWGDKLTLWGGIPSNLLLAGSTSDDEFEAYLAYLFQSIGNGRRIILGIADTTPPDAVFDRLLRIGEWVEKEGRLPLAGSATFGVPVSEKTRSLEKPKAEAPAALDEAFQDIQRDVLNGKDNAIIDHIKPLLKKGVDAQDIIQKGMVSAMMLISEEFKKGTVFIPEVLLSARTMNLALEYLEPHLAAGPRTDSGKVLLGTVHGDMHNIGKNMVAAMLRGVGLQVIDIGINVPTDIFVNKVKDIKPDILGLSALLTTTMPKMKEVIDALIEAGIREYVKVMIGGAPVNQRFADDIGADGYGKDAGEAVYIAQKLLREK